jgi:sialate O-acetylesterase
MPSPGARPNVAAIIFNAMIHPLIPYAIRGTIWYQGEANASQALEYRTLLPRLIGDWRERWGSDFPFLIVQLANWDFEPTKPEWEHQYPLLREAQAMALSLPKTGLATAIDIGNPKDVHPRNKRDVGLRLALTAKRVAYGEAIVSSGPVYKEHTIRGGEVRVRFTDTGGGLVIGKAPWLAEGATPVPQDELLGFIIRGDQGKWVPAKARIDGDSVIVSSPEVPAPKAIRYAWANSPRCNLYNQEGLPALPFRTDID